MKEIVLRVPRYLQPEDECGPTCLKQVLDYYRLNVNLEDLIREYTGTLKSKDWGYSLGVSALKRGFKATIYDSSTFIYDPTWFRLSKKELIKKLNSRLSFIKKCDEKDKHLYLLPYYGISTLENIIRFLENGGEVNFRPISKELIISFLEKGTPPICSLDACILYKNKRLYKNKHDDIRGVPYGHLVVISGYRNDEFILTDPSKFNKKSMDCNSLINAILRWDSELIIIKK